ncbi:MAG: type 1 periplasmic binding fold superfamily protein [Saprospiraceae bacterium]|nr:type 1 periplasmic binding fold superfamily protein [Saprospiraceae bacterium]
MRRLPLVFMVLIFFHACKKDDNVDPLGKQVITTLTFSLSSSGTTEPLVLSYQDLDGNGGNDPIIDGGALQANSIYFGMLELLDESITPAANITNEIMLNEEAYQVFFTSAGLDITVIYADLDNDGYPIGLFTAINTGEASQGSVIVSVVRGLNKSGVGVSDGQINNAGGEIQIQGTFPITIQ